MARGNHRWYIADAYIPPLSTPPAVSHESICVLNESDANAELTLTVYYADREPEESDVIVVPARRDMHMRTSIPDQVGGLQLRSDVPYGIVIASDAMLHIQYSRCDSTQPAYTLMTAALCLQ